jgi:hypothetical protein
MSKSSERLVVFVTPAQKRAILSTAQRLNVSVSELLRRALLEYEATGEQVRTATIVDRLHAAQTGDALNATLQRVAHGLAEQREPLANADAQARSHSETPDPSASAQSVAATVARVLAAKAEAEAALDAAAARRALELRENEATVARVTAAQSTAKDAEEGPAAPIWGSARRKAKPAHPSTRAASAHEDAEPGWPDDAAPAGGSFA